MKSIDTANQAPVPIVGQTRDQKIRAWIAVLLIPVFFGAAFVAVYGLHALAGYVPENNDAPLWLELVSLVVGVVLCLVPCVAAVLYGVRANSSGNRWALLPVGIGVVAAIWLTTISVVSTFSG